MGNALTLSGVVKPKGRARNRTVAGFRIDARLNRVIGLDGEGAAEPVHVPSSGSDVIDDDGNFTIELRGDGDPVAPVTVVVSSPEGVEVHRNEITLEEAQRPLNLKVDGMQPVSIEPSEDPANGKRITMSGRVIDERGEKVGGGLPVVLWGVPASDAGADPTPLVVTKTQRDGYFSADWTSRPLNRAFGRVGPSDPIAVRLDDSGRLPRTVLLVLDLSDEQSGADTSTPRTPEPQDLVDNPSAYSQDLGSGCVDLTTPNRTIEEFSYHMVVRTSEPDVRGLTLGDRRTVPPGAIAELIEASGIAELTEGRRTHLEKLGAMRDLALDATTAKHLVRGDRPPTIYEIGKAAWLSEITWAKDLLGAGLRPRPGRSMLDADDPVDWDASPTIFQATTLAQGHILEIREVWRADGYSLGDLLHSLPLAPGQRRQLAVVDWERRTSTAREEALEYEEALQAFAGRDRDVTEIVGSHLGQETSGGSSNATWGVAGGIGAGFIGSGFGIFGGVAGGASGSSSTSWQRSSRQFSSDSMQSLRDRVMQRASSVRDQRSTVVQTVAQGETFRAETETVANYNRCHTMTVQYFEVLRHFLVTHELADVRECLFIPFPLSPFDRGKALRWREALGRHLRNRRLFGGFDAIRRIADNWEGWDFPVSRYSEEALESLEGELRISFVLPRPRDAEDGAFQVDMWKPYAWLLPYDPMERWTAHMNDRAITERDRYFRQNIAPEIAERLVDRLRFSFVTSGGSQVEVPLDATLVSRYAEGAPLYVSIRPRGPLPSVAREDIVQFRIDYEGEGLPADAQVIVHSGKARYRTPYAEGVLFVEGRILNDISVGDPVIVPTPLNRSEIRNPRDDDRDLADTLVAHLNESIEFYHQAIWLSLDPQRRFMLLDGVEIPGLDGKSVASMVENRVIGVAGNCLIMPMSPGVRLDRRVDSESEGDLIDLYSTNPPPPTRISVPTRGVYAEAVLGDCNACEKIDDTRYWRWTTEGMLDLPGIEQVSTESRAEAERDLTPTELPKPLVQIQNAPDLPVVTGLNKIFELLAKESFTDITGLEGTQRNARAAFDAAMSAMSGVASEAGNLARQQLTGRNGERMLERISQARTDGLLSSTAAEELSSKVLGTLVGQPAPKAQTQSPVEDPDIAKVLDKAAQAEKAEIKVTTPEETLEVGFDGGSPTAGAAPVVGVQEISGFIDQPVTVETPTPGAPFTRTMQRVPLPTLAALKAWRPAHVSLIDGKFLRKNPADASKYQLFRRLRVAYPADPKDTTKVMGKGRLPVAVLVHGQHESYESGGEVRNHDGYTFLQDHLAARGIVSVSVDTNGANFFNSLIETRAEMVLAALDTLRGSNGDKSSRFHNRLDLDKVAMMGHSRGGDAVVRAGLLNAARGAGSRFGIKAICALAPTDFTGSLVPAQEHVMSGNVADFFLVVYGGLDGDVSGLGGASGFTGTGFRHYDRATTDKAMVYIPGAIHNRFNRTWSGDDFGLLPADVGRVHSRTDHEKLAIEYIGGIFEWRLTGVNARSGLFDGTRATSTGHDVSLQWAFGKASKDIERFEAGTSPVGTRTVRTSQLDSFADVKVNGVRLEPHTSHQTKVLAIDPNLPGPAQPALELKVDAVHKDWSGFDMLTFRLGTIIDVSSEAKINAGKSPPPCGVVLTDGAGNSATVDAVAFTTPDVPGKPVWHKVKAVSGIENVTLHRLATVAITLTGFAGVKLDDIKTLMIQPGLGFGQHVVIDSLRLVKRA